ncbi:MAG TPA: hypothetical protein VNA25_23820 [Phycisphaerae bacterium]|nr:hypothetical protein [Phycisphaerae bacterium]
MPTPTQTSDKTYEEMTSGEKRAYTRAKNATEQEPEPELDVIAQMAEDSGLGSLPGVPRPDDPRDGDEAASMFEVKLPKPIIEDENVARIKKVAVPEPEYVDVPIPRRGDWVIGNIGTSNPVELCLVTNVKSAGANYQGRIDFTMFGHGMAGVQVVQGAFYADDPGYLNSRARSGKDFHVPGTWRALDNGSVAKLVAGFKDLEQRVSRLEK